MEVRAHLRKRCDRLYKLFCDDPWFQRSQTNPLIPSISCTARIRLSRLSSFSNQCHRSSDEFPSARLPGIRFRQICHFCYYIFFCPASDSSSRIRDNTVRTKLVAAILHLDICSRMLPCLSDVDSHILCMIDIDHFPQITVCFFICLQRCQKILLLLFPSTISIHGSITCFSACACT